RAAVALVALLPLIAVAAERPECARTAWIAAGAAVAGIAGLSGAARCPRVAAETRHSGLQAVCERDPDQRHVRRVLDHQDLARMLAVERYVLTARRSQRHVDVARDERH